MFLSPHKFIGGPGTPGLLVAKGSILNNTVPAVVGGGTVMYVTPEDHRYIEDHERREGDYLRRALAAFRACSNLEILGDTAASRLAIMSLRFKHGDREFPLSAHECSGSQ